MGGQFGPRVRERCVLDRVRGADDACGAGLALGGPQGEAREEAAVAEFERDEGAGDVAGCVLLELLDNGVRVGRAAGGGGGRRHCALLVAVGFEHVIVGECGDTTGWLGLQGKCKKMLARTEVEEMASVEMPSKLY